VVEVDLVDEPQQRAPFDQVHLHHPPVDGIGRPNSVGETTVTLLRSNIGAPKRDVDELTHGVERACDRDPGFDRHPPKEHAEGTSGLATRQTHEGVGTQDRRIDRRAVG
jgi:hypothetical protein